MKIQSVCTKLTFLALAVAIFCLSATGLYSNNVQAATTIQITSPSNGAKFTGNDFTISGTADANATVLIQKGTTVLRQTVSDSDGKWSVRLTGLPDGQNDITAKVVKNKGYAYYLSSSNGTNVKLNQIRLSDDALNTQAGYPVSVSRSVLGMTASPQQDIFYGFSGNLDTSVLPLKIDANSPTDPQPVSGGYPADPGVINGDFTADGTKLYSPNLNGTSVSVVNVQDNSWVKNIDIGRMPLGVFRGTNNSMYVAGENNLIIIDPATDQFTTVESICTGLISSITFSTDPSYPYYYAYCLDQGKIQKVKVSNNSVQSTLEIGGNAFGGVLSADGSKLYTWAPTTQPGLVDTDKMRVVDTSTGEVVRTIQLFAGATGVLSTPDFKKLYLPTPGPDFDVENIDVIDMQDYSVQHMSLTGGVAAVVSASPATTADVADVDVGVVLGVADGAASGSAGGVLAETGVVVISAGIIGLLLLIVLIYTYADYRKHRKPLVEVDPEARRTYTYAHHIKTVTVPIMKYRVHISLSRNSPSGVQKF